MYVNRHTVTCALRKSRKLHVGVELADVSVNEFLVIIYLETGKQLEKVSVRALGIKGCVKLRK